MVDDHRESHQYYTRYLRQSFVNFSDELDPARIEQLIQRGRQDAEWVLKSMWVVALALPWLFLSTHVVHTQHVGRTWLITNQNAMAHCDGGIVPPGAVYGSIIRGHSCQQDAHGGQGLSLSLFPLSVWAACIGMCRFGVGMDMPAPPLPAHHPLHNRLVFHAAVPVITSGR